MLTSNTNLVSTEYKNMLSRIQEHMPAIENDMSNFYKSHSQYMSVLLDVTAITPIRRVKHILAEINRTKMALEEAYISQQKSDIERRKLIARRESFLESLEAELLEIEILECEFKIKNISNSIQGAIRKLSFFVTQYESVLNLLGKDNITEAEYEKEENRYHIMTAMRQALSAARAHGGLIDEGNQIYLFDLGINGMVAQNEVLNYLNMETKILEDGREPTHEMTMKWLEACADKFVECAGKSAKSRGYVLLDEQSLSNNKYIKMADKSTK